MYQRSEKTKQTLWGLEQESKYDVIYFESDNYMHNFGDKHVYVNDNIKFLEKRFDTAFKAFEDMKISMCVQYCVGECENPSGFISFNKSKFTLKWSELDIAYLSILGHVLGMELIHGRKKS